MSKISYYPSADEPLQLSDRLIGTEAPRIPASPTPLATKNFSLGELLNLFSGNFPAANLQAVLNAGNTATQNITLVGTIDTTLIRPDNIEDTSGSQGTVFQYLSKGASSINWVDLPVDNLQAVLDAGNTATQSITLVGNITSTRIIPGNIQDDTTGIGITGQFLSKTASGIRWVNAPATTTPGLGDVLSVGNTAINDINLTGNVTATSFIKTGGTNLQYLMADGSVTTGGGSSTLVALPFTTDHISATGNQYVIGDVVWYLGNVYRCIASNDSIIPTNALYWVNIGAGYSLVQQPADWNSTSGNNQILNKPTIPTLTSQLTNDVPFLTQDNVVEYPDLASFPVTGVIGTIYIALDTGLFYSWSGSAYVLSSPPSTGITGVGLSNYVGRWTSPTTMGTGIIRDDGSNVGINVAPNASYRLNVNGNANVSSFLYANVFAPQTAIIYDGGGNLGNRTRGGRNVDYFAKGDISTHGNITFSDGNYLTAGTETARFDTYDRRLGIRTTTPTEALDVDGNIRNRGFYYDETNSSGTAGQLLSSTVTGTDWIDAPTGGGIPHATAAGTDTYTATITGVTAYNDADAFLIRFTNGNTTSATLNVNSLGAIPLYRNNDGILIGGDIISGGEMLCVYNSTTNRFQVIGTAPNSLFSYVTNNDSVTLTKGMPVYAFSGTGDRMTVKRANNTGDATSAQTVGLVLSTSIGVNQKGLIMMQGLLDGLSILPTSTWADGDAVYLGATDGSITNIKPHAPNHLVYLGVVTTASNGAAGRMYVRVQNGYELQELHNVQAQTPSLNDTLWYDNTVSPAQWKTASIPTILGYTPPKIGLVQAMTQGLQNIF